MGRTHDHAAGGDLRDLFEAPLAHEKRVHRILGERDGRAEDGGQMRLRIEVDAERTQASLRNARQETRRDRRLACSARLIEARDHRNPLKLIAPASRSCAQTLPRMAREPLSNTWIAVGHRKSAIISGPMLLQIAILAAGKGKRMHSARPKVLHSLAGKPLLAHVLATARAMNPRAICIVEGAGDEVRQAFSDPDLVWARQDPPRGTGDALRCALARLPADGVTLVLFGADPMARVATLQRVVEQAERGALSLLTVDLDDPAGYGRIVRAADGTVAAIVEHNEATAEQQAIREINTGVMAAPTHAFARWLAEVRTNNKSGEYFLTDVIALAVRDSVAVRTTRAPDPTEGLGINSRRDLAELERRHQRLTAEALLDAGGTLMAPASAAAPRNPSRLPA